MEKKLTDTLAHLSVLANELDAQSEKLRSLVVSLDPKKCCCGRLLGDNLLVCSRCIDHNLTAYELEHQARTIRGN